MSKSRTPLALVRSPHVAQASRPAHYLYAKLLRRSGDLRHVSLLALLLALPLSAQVSGVVMNRTTGQPVPNATVGLMHFDSGGMKPAGEIKTGADGKFAFPDSAAGPTLLRSTWDGVTYNKMLPPGTPTTNVTFDVYESSKQPGDAKVSKHMILFEPADGMMSVNETFMYDNADQTTWNDHANGTLRAYIPAGFSKLTINATAPGGMSVPATGTKTNQPNIFKVDFPIKPGETRFDLTYSFPYKIGDQLEGKVATKDDNTYLIVPNGITLKAENVNDLGVEPRTQAHIFGLTGSTYNIQLTGAEVVTPDSAAAPQDDAGPQITPILPRLYGQSIPILAISLAILGLGFVLLYRKEAPGRQ